MITKPCPGPDQCGHSDAEHEAFDAGMLAGERGIDPSENPYSHDELSETWLIGHSVTYNYE